MTTRALADWLTAAVESDLSLTCAKGFSAWDRPTLSSNAFIEWQTTAPGDQLRIGSTQDTFVATFQLVAMTANEVALWAVVDLLQAMVKARTEATVDGARYRVHWSAITRVEQQAETTEALRYAAAITVQITR